MRKSRVRKDSLLIPDVLPNTDLIYSIIDKGIKEEVILKNKLALGSVEVEPLYKGSTSVGSPAGGGNEDPVYKFRIEAEGVRPEETAAGIYSPVFVDAKTGEYAFHFLKPFMYDSAGARSDDVALLIRKEGSTFSAKPEGKVDPSKESPTGPEGLIPQSEARREGSTLAENSTYYVALVPSAKWLADPARLYPIHIDPSIVHDTTIKLGAGSLNRAKDTGSGSSPAIETTYQELPADIHTVGLWHMNNAWTDSSGNGNTGTANGNAAFTTSSKLGGYAGTFDGTGDYIDLGDTASLEVTKSFTIEAWVYPTAWAGTGTYKMIASKWGDPDPSGTREIYFLLDENGRLLSAAYDETNNQQINANSSNGALTLNTWHHVAAIWDGGNAAGALRSYVDGVEVGTNTANTSFVGIDDLTANWRIADDVGGNGQFSGTIDEVRISNIARTPEEIKMDASRRPYSVVTSDVIDSGQGSAKWQTLKWTEAGVPSTSSGLPDGETPYSTNGLVAQWNFNETSGTTASNAATGNASCGSTCNGTLTSFASTASQDQAAGTGWTANNKRWGAGALMFDGGSDYVSAATTGFPTTDALKTGEAWVKTSTIAFEIIYNDNVIELSTNSSGNFQATARGQSRCNSNIKIADGNWHHVAATLSSTGSSGTSVYVDGKLANTCTETSGGALGATAYIGQSGSSSQYFNGVIDTVSIYNRALPASEILANYNASNIEFETRTGATLDPNDGTWEAWKPITSEAALDAMDGYQYNTTDTGLVSYWPMDEASGNLTDVKGSNTGTPTGTTIVDGKFGKARNLTNANSEYINLGNGASLQGYSAITVELWAKAKSFPTNWGLANKHRAGYSDNTWTLRDGSGDNTKFYFVTYGASCSSTIVYLNGKQDAAGADGVVSNSQLQTNTWYHIVATSSGCTNLGTNSHNAGIGYLELSSGGGTPNLFFDGIIDEARIYSSALSATTIQQHYAEGADAYIGNNLHPSLDTSLKMEGTGSEKLTIGAPTVDGNTVALWHLDETTSAATDIKDSSPNANNSTAVTGTTVVDGFYGKGRSFNGSSDYIQGTSPVFGTTANVTISAWVKPNAVPAVIGPIFSTDSGFLQCGLAYTSSGTVIPYHQGNSFGAGYALTNGQWHHIAAVFPSLPTNPTIDVYVDGIKRFSGTSTNTSYCGTGFEIGAQNGSFYFNGAVDEPKIDNVARSADEIAEAYRAGRDHRVSKALTSVDLSSKTKVPFYVASDRPGTFMEATIGESAFANYEPDTNTVGLWHLEENLGVGTTSPGQFRDSSGNGNNGSVGIGNSIPTSVQGKIGKALSFNGTSHYVNAGNTTSLNITGAITMSVWVYKTATQLQTLIVKGVGGNVLPWEFDIKSDDTIAYVESADGATWGTQIEPTSPTVSSNAWHYIVATNDTTTAKLYLDGVLIGTDSTPVVTKTTNSIPVTIGGNSSNRYFSGILDEVRIDNTARTADQIRQAYEIGARTHPITIDFVTSPQAAYTSGTSLTINNPYGTTALTGTLNVGDTIILKENKAGTETIGTATIKTISNTSTSYGTVTVETAPSFPSGGYTTAAKVFKWQREYMDLSGSLTTQRDAITRLTLRATDGSQGANVWLDDFRSGGAYLTTPAGTGSTITSSDNRYFQYRAIDSSSDPAVSSNLSKVSVGYTTNNMSQWKFDEGQGAVAYDSGVNGNNGTISGATWQSEDMCVSGKCVYLPGSGGSGVTATVTQARASVLSVSAWIKPISVSSTRQEFVASGNSATYPTSNWGFSIKGNTSNNGSISVFGSSAELNTGATAVVNANVWQFVSFTSDGTTVNIYVNGSLVKSGALAINNNNATGEFIGRAANLTYQGFIDNVKIYPYARSAAQVKADYDSGLAKLSTPKGSAAAQGGPLALSQGLVGYWKMDEASGTASDSSGNGNTGTWGGSGSHYVAGKFGNGGGFETNDTINAGAGSSLDVTGSITLSAWIKPNGTQTAYSTIIDKSHSSTVGWTFEYDSGGTTVNFTLSNGSSTTFPNLMTTSTLTDNNWHHLVGTYDGTTAKIFIDGNLQRSLDFTGGSATSTNLFIGSWLGSGRYFNGKIDDARIYNRALSPAEVRALYNWNPVPVAQYRMDEGSGTAVNDTSSYGNNGTLQSPLLGNSQASWVTGKYGKGLSFNGIDNYGVGGTAPSLNLTGGLSVSAFIKPSAVTVSGSAYTPGGTIAGKGGNYTLKVESDTFKVGDARAAFSTNAITTQLSGTAVHDVYFYDTTKDTDYGTGKSTDPLVWRFDSTKSWYSETKDHTYTACVVASDDRCGNSEFPEKSYIVATNDNLYIYDAQENAMWMKFQRDTNYMALDGGNGTGIFALNGKVYVSSANWFRAINFVGDTAKAYNTSGVQSWQGNISNRNGGSSYGSASGSGIVNNVANDVHAAVIAGVTYVAVATGTTTGTSGISVINETAGTVVNGSITAPPYAYNKVFIAGTTLYTIRAGAPTWGDGILYAFYNFTAKANYDDGSSNASYRGSSYPAYIPNTVGGSMYDLYVTQGTSTVDGTSNTIYLPTDQGVAVIQENQSSTALGSLKRVTKDFVSEEMVGDIRGMWPMGMSNGSLIGIGSTRPTGALLDDASVKDTDMTVVADAGGVAVAQGVRGAGITFDGTDDYLKQKVYLSAAQSARVDTAGSAAITITGLATYATASQPYAYMVVSTNCTTTGWGYLGAVISGDNLKVFSTKTGTTQNWAAVGSGGTCDTFEVRKTDFQITGSFTAGTWVKTTTSYAGAIMSKHFNLSGANNMSWYLKGGAGNLIAFISSGTGQTTAIYNLTWDSNWHFVSMVYTSSTSLKLYFDGQEVASNTTSIPSTINDVSYPLLVHTILNSGGALESDPASTIDEPFVTATALTADEIKNMYEIGKRALTAGGTNTLNGTSNQVNAVVAGGLTRRLLANQGVSLSTARLFAGTEGGGVSEIDLNSDTLVTYYTAATTPAINNANINALTYTSGGGFVAGLDSGVSRLNSVSGKSSPSTTSWTAVSGEFDKTTGYYNLYENGIKTGSVNVGTGHSPVSNSLPLSLGSSASSATYVSYPFYGGVDNVEVWNYGFANRGASTTMVGKGATVGNPSAGSGSPAAYWRFDEGQGPVARSSVWNSAGTTTNLVTNSSLETNTTGWSSIGGNGSLSRTTTTSLYGGAAGALVGGTDYAWGRAGFSNIPVTAAGSYIFSAWVKAGTGGIGKVLGVTMIGDNSGESSGGTITLTGDWQRISYSKTLNSSDTEFSYVAIVIWNDSTGFTFYFDGAQLTQTSSALPYCDGSLTGNGTHSWTGTAHASTSTCTYGQDGEINGATWTANGKFNKALSFNGTSNYVDVPNSTALNITGDISLSTWVKPTALSASMKIAGKGDDSSWTNLQYQLIIDSSNSYKFRFGVNDGSGTSTYYVLSTTIPTTGQWYHVIGVRNGTSLKIYVNGKLENTATIFSGNLITTTNTLRIGYTSNSGWPFNGSIDEVKIYPYALTEDEVRLDYNHGTALSLGSLSVDSSNVPLNSSTSSYCVPGSSDSCSAPVAEWSFDENTGSSVYDSSGNANTGTWNGTGTQHWKPGKISSAGNFNGTDDYVDVSDSPSLDLTTAVTVEAWIKPGINYPTSPVNWHEIVTKYYANEATYGISYLDTESGRLVFEIRDGSTEYQVRPIIALTAGQWYHVVGTYDGSNLKFFVNGVLQDTTAHTGSITPNDASLRMGMAGGGGRYFNGLIDQVRIFNYARTASQIAWDYNRGGPVGWWRFDECQGTMAYDASGNSNNGTITIGATGTNTSAGTCTGSVGEAWKDGATGKYNSSLEFDGTDDYVSAGTGSSLDFGTGSVSLSAWIKLASLPSSLACIANKGNAGIGAQRGASLCINSTGQIRLFVTRDAEVSDATTNTVSTGTWAHVVGIDDGTNHKIYLNGQLIQNIAAPTGSLTDASIPMTIGRLGTQVSQYFDGQIDDVRIFNYALTATQIKTLYNENFGVRFGPSSGTP